MPDMCRAPLLQTSFPRSTSSDAAICTRARHMNAEIYRMLMPVREFDLRPRRCAQPGIPRHSGVQRYSAGSILNRAPSVSSVSTYSNSSGP
jgi:hypothetical protein